MRIGRSWELSHVALSTGLSPAQTLLVVTPARSTRPTTRSAEVRARDGALRRLSALNRLAVAGAAAMVLGFTAMAAKATPPRHHATAPITAPATPRPAAGAPQSSSDDRRAVRHHTYKDKHHRHQRPRSQTASQVAPQPQPQIPAPAPTPQPPVVISGGS